MIELVDTKTMIEKIKAGQIAIDKKRSVKIEYGGKDKYIVSSLKNYFPVRTLNKKEITDFISGFD